MGLCSGERVEAVARRKGFWWSREDTAVNFPTTGSMTFSEM